MSNRDGQIIPLRAEALDRLLARIEALEAALREITNVEIIPALAATQLAEVKVRARAAIDKDTS